VKTQRIKKQKKLTQIAKIRKTPRRTLRAFLNFLKNRFANFKHIFPTWQIWQACV